MTKKEGFTLIELIIVIAVISILASIALPGYSRWLPNYRLKGAARDLYSHLQMAKMGAVRTRTNWAVVFDAATNSYRVCSNDGGDGDWTDGDETVEQTVTLTNYGSGVGYGPGNATNDIPGSGAAPADFITFSTVPDVVIFDPRGTCNDTGYVYLDNLRNATCFGVGTLMSGGILIRKWTGTAWE